MTKIEGSFNEILNLIEKARYNALKSVNSELITLYCNVGEYISKKVEKEEWGMSTVDKLADDMGAKAYVKILLLRATIEHHKYNFPKAFEYLKEARDIDPNNREVLEALAFNCERVKDKESALGHYNKLLEIEPDNIKYLGMKAGILSSTGFYKGALEIYEKILKFDSMNCDIINEMAKLYETLGNRQEAINCYDKLIQFCPSYPFAKDEMHKLMYKLIAYA